jgi:putative ATPase
MREIGYGKDYAYDHNEADNFSGQNYFPDQMGREQFYDPKGLGFEAELKKRLTHWTDLRRKKAG